LTTPRSRYPFYHFLLSIYSKGGIFLCLLVTVFLLGCNNELEVIDAEVFSLPEAGRINKIKFKNDLEGYALGGVRWESGFLYQTLDGGKTWRSIPSVSDVADFHLTDIAFLSDQNYIAVGYGGMIFYSADAGASWEFSRNLNWEQFECVLAIADDQFVFAGGQDSYGGSFGKNSPGEWWNLELQPLPVKAFDLHQNNNGELLVAGYSGIFKKSSLEDSTWHRTQLTGDIFTSFSFPAANLGFVCGFNGSVWQIDQAGRPISLLIPGSPLLGRTFGWYDIHFPNVQAGVVVGLHSECRLTTDGGQKWTAYQIDGTNSIYAVFMKNLQEVWIGGDNGYLAKVNML